MDLVEVYALAETNDPKYRQTVYSTLATREVRPQARSQLLPNANFNGDTTYNDQEIGGSGPTTVDGDVSFNSRGYNVSVTQPLFRWDRYLTLKQTDSIIQQSEAEQLSAQQELIIRVAEAYFNILAAIDNIQFAKAETKSLGRSLEQAKQRFEVGLTAITDVAEAQAGFDRATADDILAEALLDDTKEDMRAITGEYINQLTGLRESMPLVTPDPNDIEQWTKTAESQNMIIIASKYKLESARQQVNIEKSGHLPTVDLIASHGYNKSGGRFGDSSARATGVGVELNIPLFQGGLITSNTRQARHLYDQSRQELEEAFRAAQRDTRQAYLGIIAGISRVKALKQTLVSTEIALKATETGFEVGTRTAVDVVAFERATLEAKRNHARARYNYLLNTLRLKQAAGTLIPEDLKHISAWLEPSAWLKPKRPGPIQPEIVELFPDATLKLEETCFSCTGAEQFLQKLEETGRKQVILVGIEAHVCVLQTAIHLIAEGYQVFVAADCICSRNRENYEASLKRMSQAGVVICNAESVLFEWIRDAKHDSFKELSQLVL
jgi:outer membrane protein